MQHVDMLSTDLKMWSQLEVVRRVVAANTKKRLVQLNLSEAWICGDINVLK